MEPEAQPEAADAATEEELERARLLGARLQGFLLGFPLVIGFLSLLGGDPSVFRYQGF